MFSGDRLAVVRPFPLFAISIQNEWAGSRTRRREAKMSKSSLASAVPFNRGAWNVGNQTPPSSQEVDRQRGAGLGIEPSYMPNRAPALTLFRVRVRLTPFTILFQCCQVKPNHTPILHDKVECDLTEVRRRPDCRTQLVNRSFNLVGFIRRFGHSSTCLSCPTIFSIASRCSSCTA